MKVKRIIALILITAIVYTGLASFVAWLIIRNDRKSSQSTNSTNIESVLTGNDDMEIEDGQGSAICMMSY
ncbi:MAG: hypothetical protein E7364_07515 [Clostridiales bacterium]|nr:hypothetical protein [Clostridiales bacterium]